MMKKLVALFLSAMMAMSLVACGGDDTTADNAGQQVEDNADAGDEVEDEVADEVVEDELGISPDAIYLEFGIDSVENIAIVDMLDLEGSAWSLSGGLLDGVEMTQDEYVAALEQNYNGMHEFVFDADGVAYMAYAGHTENPVVVPGSYVYNEDGLSVSMQFDINGQIYSYVGYLALVDDGNGGTVSVLVTLSDGSDMTNALYYILE